MPKDDYYKAKAFVVALLSDADGNTRTSAYLVDALMSEFPDVYPTEALYFLWDLAYEGYITESPDCRSFSCA